MNTFNKFVLRRLFNVDHVGRGEAGTIRRKEFKITLTPKTYLSLRTVIDIGPGRYGSSVMELCLRTMLATMGVFERGEFDKVCEELALSIMDRTQFAANLHSIAQQVEAYTGTL